MHTVGDRGDLVADPHPGEETAAHLAVQLGDPVGPTGQTQGERGHIEVTVVAGVLSQGQEFLDRCAPPLRPGLEVGDHQIAVEAVDTRRHRGVGREHQPGTNPSDGGIDVPTVDHPVDQLEGDEAGVTLVEMMHWGQPPQRGQCPGTSDAEHHLLIEAMMAVTAVEPVGDPTVVLAVRLEVRVQDEKRDPAHIDAPNPGGDVPTGEWDAHHHTGVQSAQVDRVDGRVVLRLPSIGDLLIEIAMSIEEPDTDQREPPIAGSLQMVTGKDPEATGILGYESIDTEFRRAIGDLRCHRIGQDGVEVCDLHGDTLDKHAVTEQIIQLFGGEVRHNRDRVSGRSRAGQ